MRVFGFVERSSFLIAVLILVLAAPLRAQEQSRESMAVDATATQWSYQFAVEGNFDYKDDVLDNGRMRAEGNRGFFQFRLVAPLPKGKLPLTLLPRLTMRLVEEKNEGNYGFGQSDVFVLGIVQQWATGRWGLGPQINFPAEKGFGNPEWGYGLAGAITQRALDDKLFLVLLLQQTWSKDPSGLTNDTKASPLGINPGIVYQLGKGYYVGNGDFVISYNWNDGSWFVPLRLRLGKAWIQPTRTFNAYVEYGTALDYRDWQGSVANHTVRINFQFQLPLGL